MMKRGNEQGPTSGEIMTTEEVAESLATPRASDRIVSVNVEEATKQAEVAKRRAELLAAVAVALGSRRRHSSFPIT